MKLKDILTESTYDLSKLQDLFDFFEKKVNKKINFPLINITRYFKDFIGDEKVFVWLNFGSRKEAVLAGVTQKNNTVVIVVDRKEIKNTFKDDYLMDESEALLKAFKHEVIHVLDYIRQIKYGEDKKPKFINVSSKRNRFEEKQTDEVHKLLRYLNNDYEFNRIVNEIQEEKRNNTQFWKGLERANDVNTILDYFLKKIILFRFDDDEFFNDLSKLKTIIYKDKNLKEKIIKRLLREGLIPSFRG